jgi:Ser/Thr protein kinase RdoA (MazF antagonist)
LARSARLGGGSASTYDTAVPKCAPTVTQQQAIALARLWDAGAREVTHLRSGENSVWGFEGRGRHILRVTSDVHRTRDQLLAELVFVEHLVANGADAAHPVESLTGEKVVDVSAIVGSEGATYATVFERLEGRHFEFYSNDIDRPLFEAWGRAMGRLHLLAETFVAPAGLRRPDWTHDEVAGCPVIGVHVDDGLLSIRNELVGRVSGMARHSPQYGMVHGDFERTNFVLNDGTIRVFDFDDCCHHWFCWDIVCALWVFRNASKDDRAAFLGWFLNGYSAVRELDATMLERFSDLVRLRTVGLLLYRARTEQAPSADDWAQRTRSWLDAAWDW